MVSMFDKKYQEDIKYDIAQKLKVINKSLTHYVS